MVTKFRDLHSKESRNNEFLQFVKYDNVYIMSLYNNIYAIKP